LGAGRIGSTAVQSSSVSNGRAMGAPSLYLHMVYRHASLRTGSFC
jgi:hypothetical protein